MRPEKRSPWSSAVIGLAILAIGVIFWLDRIEKIEARDLFHYLPLLLIAFAVAALIERHWVAAAAWFFVTAVFYADGRPWAIFGAWPLLISIGGVSLMMQAFRPRNSAVDIHAVAVMGANSRTFGSQPFSGGEVVAVMGGCEIDLSSAQPPPSGEAVIDVLAFWGGVAIKVPAGWQVVSRVVPILAGYDDRTAPALGVPRLIIRGSVIMGGVEVVNP